ncbi:MAG: peptide chain release factor N(5)-glutamine methyltransferase [Pseudomonadales bacterium]|nr:peptide chain release factor N(5)-glutamine methyltransferase [Pseudomonadales bacterium]
MNNKNIRVLSPYEKNQLLFHGIDQEVLLNTAAPVEYVTGHVNFCNSDFLVNKKVLIPRIETEELVSLAVDEAEKIFKANGNKKIKIVDVGSGSGAIAISVAKYLINRNISFELTGLEISREAISLAKKNLSIINPKLPVSFVKSNLLEAINVKVKSNRQGEIGRKATINQQDIINRQSATNSQSKIDLIIANLPYIPSDRIQKLDASVKNFEPLLALDGGKDGLELIRKLLSQAKPLLKMKGVMLLELDITHDFNTMQQFSNDWKIKINESLFSGVNFGIIYFLK